MKQIMISIQPQWVKKILNGEKTIEIRKTMPKCELPCKVYIYETKSKWLKPYHNTITNKIVYNEYEGRGKVVAEFTLNKVEQYRYVYSPTMFICGYRKVVDDSFTTDELDYGKCCLTPMQLSKYANIGSNYFIPAPIYAWHIDNLKIYDKPKELSEFGLKKPPQSWQYIKEQRDED